MAPERDYTPPRVRPDHDAASDRTRGGLLFLAVVAVWSVIARD